MPIPAPLPNRHAPASGPASLPPPRSAQGNQAPGGRQAARPDTRHGWASLSRCTETAASARRWGGPSAGRRSSWTGGWPPTPTGSGATADLFVAPSATCVARPALVADAARVGGVDDGNLTPTPAVGFYQISGV